MSSRGYPITELLHQERRKAAEKRTATRAALTRKQKLALCDERRGECRRERARLERT